MNDEIDERAVDKVPMEASSENAVIIEKGSFRWSDRDDDPLVLKKFVVQI